MKTANNGLGPGEYSQGDLGRVLKVSKPTISRYLREMGMQPTRTIPLHPLPLKVYSGAQMRAVGEYMAKEPERSAERRRNAAAKRAAAIMLAKAGPPRIITGEQQDEIAVLQSRVIVLEKRIDRLCEHLGEPA